MPASEPAGLTVVAIVGEKQFWPDEKDVAIQTQHTAVVAHPLVHDWHAEVAQQAISTVIRQELCKDLPRVGSSVLLEKVVFTAIPRNFELRPETKRCAAFLASAIDLRMR
eukprot:CAMPEP_0173105664 /NCGR_PEP_ID=MMETSP1102-20130122/40306_1 /TAXON_ID=49646 /ORGANISM="Geminigera sp., Strain Caron Lab Isolate" /LENGTH=109 /DNA_ID=CAMNT_0014002085 /DNA_START=160 /DNA_END=487 /DNA_ORIENTATION=-